MNTFKVLVAFTLILFSVGFLWLTFEVRKQREYHSWQEESQKQTQIELNQIKKKLFNLETAQMVILREIQPHTKLLHK